MTKHLCEYHNPTQQIHFISLTSGMEKIVPPNDRLPFYAYLDEVLKVRDMNITSIQADSILCKTLVVSG